MVWDLFKQLVRPGGNGPSSPLSNEARTEADRLIGEGNRVEQDGRLREACALYRKAVDAAPGYAKAQLNLGIGLEALGDIEGAVLCHGAAHAADPADPYASYNLGRLLHTRGAHERAEALLRSAVERRPDFAEALFWLGNALVAQGRSDDAAACYRRAVELQPRFAAAWLHLGNVHAARGRLAEAADCFRRALALEPAIAEAHLNLGHALKDMGQARDALACYQAALLLNPDFAEARWSAAMCSIPVLRGAGDDLKQIRAAAVAEIESLDRWFDGSRAAEGYRAVGVQQPFWVAYQEEDNRELLQRYGRLCARLMGSWMERQGLRSPQPRRRVDASPLRVGVVSRYFRDHSVWNALVKGWFQQLDRSRLELMAFSLGFEEDAETRYARSRAARFEHGKAGLREWVETILKARPDVLIYPEIGMDPMTVKLASLRLAPVQAAAWGHPETSGLPTMDYYLSAEDLEPPDAQANYTERLVALPRLGCFVEPARAEKTAIDLSAWGIEDGVPLLVCPGTPFKYAPEHDWIFPEIARRLGRCRFVFFTHWTPGLSGKLRARLADAFTGKGLDFDRHAVFVPWQPKASFYALLRRADVFLDTLGFSGFNTALQALECGLPIVTREGRFLRGRLASGLLKRAGLSDLVAATEQDYVALAVKLARDREYRQQVREGIERGGQHLFGDMEPVQALEKFLVQATRPS